jgi:hypothetical protein
MRALLRLPFPVSRVPSLDARPVFSHLTPPSRPLFHLPVLGVVAGAALKKVTIHSIIKKLGANRLLRDVRSLNASLHQRSPSVHPIAARDRVNGTLDVLDRSLKGLQEQEQLQYAWKWFESLEKQSPSFAQVVLKTYVETLTPVKWASSLVQAVLKDGGVKEAPIAGGQKADGGSTNGDALLKKLHAAAPELSRYHVLLIPKDFEESDAESSPPTPDSSADGLLAPQPPASKSTLRPRCTSTAATAVK